MLNGSVPFIYNRIGNNNNDKSLQLIEPFKNSVEFWDKLPLMEYGKTRNQFPEFLEQQQSDTDYKDKKGSDEILPGITKDGIEKLKSKLEL